MPVDKATVSKIAALARIRVPEDELERLAGELSDIIGWVERLDEADTEGVQPMNAAATPRLRRRDDAVTDGDVRDRILANAPAAQDGFFLVPKVVE